MTGAPAQTAWNHTALYLKTDSWEMRGALLRRTTGGGCPTWSVVCSPSSDVWRPPSGKQASTDRSFLPGQACTAFPVL